MKPLTADVCRRICDPTSFSFTTTADLPPTPHIIGQPRGSRAIEFGTSILSHGYNVYVLGAAGTGRATTIERFVQERAKTQPVPPDWIYVHNFSLPHKPRAISLLPGEGTRFRARMGQLIQQLRQDLPQAFDTDTYRETIAAEKGALEKQQDEMLQAINAKAMGRGLSLARTPSGFSLVPVKDGRQLTPEALQQLPPEERQQIEAAYRELADELTATLETIHKLETAVRQRMKQIDREVAAAAIQHHFEALRETYGRNDELLLYLQEVHQDVLDQIDDFAPPVDHTEEIDLRRYEVNLLVDNSTTQGAPVILEDNPTYRRLFGYLEYENRAGLLSTHFTDIKCGTLHHANGGYLIVNAHDLLQAPRSWEMLKRSLKAEQIHPESPSQIENSPVPTKSLDPEPIPLVVKIILLGSSGLYYALHEQDIDFGSLFKVRADFVTRMPRTPHNEQEYALFIAARCHEEGLHHFDTTAVAKVVEFGSRLAEYQEKLSTRFGAVADLVREASYWAGANAREVVTAADVQQALRERIGRANRTEESIFEQILDGSIFIATEGKVVGQVNGLSVIDTGEYTFGQPGRITARTFMGDNGVIHIEHETDMSGPIHHKGVLTLTGYLGGTYAQEQPLSLTASLTFEQNYVGVDGDSASSTELYALISSLSRIPLKQSIAVTGSVNQRGEIQPIGGVNEKVEGFFRLCCERGLNGEQGVIIPASNVPNLMLNDDVITAVAANQFHIWPVKTIDEGIELLTGLPAGVRSDDGSYAEGSVHHAVQMSLRALAEELSKFGNRDDGEDDED